jgi:hypothetical protein
VTMMTDQQKIELLWKTLDGLAADYSACIPDERLLSIEQVLLKCEPHEDD